MRIFSGLYKGTNIQTSSRLAYRPTKAIVRKSIYDRFNNLESKSVLDLFSGSGTIGFEALSRGAKSIVFVEKDIKIFQMLIKNSKKFPKTNIKFYNMDAFSFLKLKSNFDFIYADPPYGKYNVNLLVEKILGRLNHNGVFILECQKKENLNPNSKTLDFGNSRLLIWEKF